MKSTVEEIRQRFDNDVERFSVLETGQSATMDAPLVLELISQCAAATTPAARDMLDIGCGAGNYTLKLLSQLPDMNATLVDLSRPMLDRASQRVSSATTGRVTVLQGDVREVDLGVEKFDLITAAAVLHHLRTKDQWRSVFKKFHACLKPGGSLWIADLIEHEIPAVQMVLRARFGNYLTQLKDEAYRDTVLAYVEKEDTPAGLMFQLDLLREVGFSQVDVLHKNAVFAAFCAVK